MAAKSAFLEQQLPVPEQVEEIRKDIVNFIQCQSENGRNIVLITSGGTKVPLESRTVRFLDNFSSGTRGAASTEYFLQEKYAVIFLHRNHSMKPFLRHFSHLNFLDMLQSDSDDKITVKEEYSQNVLQYLKSHEETIQQNTLLNMPFQTLGEYLHLLQTCCQCLNEYGNKVLVYLAAAVSDFYIPKDEMPEHKIQSSSGPLQLQLQLVPKMLEPLVKDWVPDAFVVSFKLETNKDLLVSKAQQALEKYNHQIVVANQLETRKKEVMLVTKDSFQEIHLSEENLLIGKEIEEDIIKELINRHTLFCA